ncbi:MAG: LysM peptidoglycan-binding domain-containing protein [Opitutae bacterium]|nr:LysM peptidoglycan-binding domain-containing protein [Opitutae bacterium]
MKILQIFGAVVAVHLLAFIFIFASPGCQGSPRNVPTPDATVPTGSSPSVSYSSGASEPAVSAPADLGTAPALYTPGRATPTRPGSPNAAAITPAKAEHEDVAPVSTYTVQKGDSLWSIAKKNHLTVGELAKANSLGASTPLQPGKKLIIPGKPGAAASPKDLGTAPAAAAAADKPATPAHAAGSEAVKHTVLAGESLGTIARKYQVTVGELAAANNITDPAKIRVGQTLAIPGFKAVGAKKPSAKPAASAPATAAADKPAAETAPANAVPHFEIKAPPPGQDLDAGLKDNTATDVPTIKVEEPKTEEPPKK